MSLVRWVTKCKYIWVLFFTWYRWHLKPMIRWAIPYMMLGQLGSHPEKKSDLYGNSYTRTNRKWARGGNANKINNSKDNGQRLWTLGSQKTIADLNHTERWTTLLVKIQLDIILRKSLITGRLGKAVGNRRRPRKLAVLFESLSPVYHSQLPWSDSRGSLGGLQDIWTRAWPSHLGVALTLPALSSVSIDVSWLRDTHVTQTHKEPVQELGREIIFKDILFIHL